MGVLVVSRSYCYNHAAVNIPVRVDASTHGRVFLGIYLPRRICPHSSLLKFSKLSPSMTVPAFTNTCVRGLVALYPWLGTRNLFLHVADLTLLIWWVWTNISRFLKILLASEGNTHSSGINFSVLGYLASETSLHTNASKFFFWLFSFTYTIEYCAHFYSLCFCR